MHLCRHTVQSPNVPHNALTQTLSWCQSLQAASIKARGQFPCQRVPSQVQAGPKTGLRRYIISMTLKGSTIFMSFSRWLSLVGSDLTFWINTRSTKFYGYVEWIHSVHSSHCASHFPTKSNLRNFSAAQKCPQFLHTTLYVAFARLSTPVLSQAAHTVPRRLRN